MLSQRHGAGAYKQTNYLTADPVKLVIMCYEKTIDSLKTAKGYYQTGQYEAKAKSVQKAQDIISELNMALNFKSGGEVAKNLDILYKYMLRRILEADINRNLNILDEVIWMLEELNSAWKQIFNIGQNHKQPTASIHNSFLNKASLQHNSSSLHAWSV